MNYFYKILLFFFFFGLALPQNAIASGCCSTNDTCHKEAEKENNDEPCGSSTCDCICCGSISLVLLEPVIIESDVQIVYHLISSNYQSLAGLLFHSTIWQPPRLI